MSAGDFYGSEKSVTIKEAGQVRIEHVAADGSVTVLKEKTAVKAGEIIDASAMSKRRYVTLLPQKLRMQKLKMCCYLCI